MEVLVVFIAELVGGDVGACFGVADVHHLVGIFFDADLAQVAQCAQNR